MARNWLCPAEALRPVLLKLALEALVVHEDVAGGAGGLGWGWCCGAGLCLHGAGCRGTVSHAASSLGAGHRLWIGLSQREGERGCPWGGHILPREPHGPTLELPFCCCLWQPGEGGESPAWGRSSPSLLLLPPCTALPASVPSCPPSPAETPTGTISCHASLNSADPCALLSVQQQAAWGGLWVLINVLFSILPFPCLGLL